ncbi:glycan biosynthesis protein (PigL), putative [Trichophyton benhamiae CBS 112371]|uniref:N-acetylglucosaminyl-phosphatidylinositol de-N-acetylase n=1 Tax=Arthroderma benhamiae (strain ATCC MYA-4681 / CBS 112371) TaxID=663331 RepID=GPI12_ARTBC|nr:glycan biosynthesis protein (PigL), putative [Trichophyton benhamiae CBS 112371]D4B4K9.1 RecName: Full=N-acetylglucosaminyl-phosphatidylinositol de-N-acetylase [Trichophyton benhamiae CBS 112371]EFE30057.1 glycan biosynthesis protein (PigL), putative [Trichophyton benhamiae CBS 112371]
MNSAFTFLSLAIFPLALFIFWTLSATGPSSPLGRGFPTLTNKRICLLIAHPDDEAMFFAPTLLALTKPELGNHVKILCLSSGMCALLMVLDSASGWFLIYQITGDAAGLGHIRKQELQKSALRLGLRNESDVFIVDDPSRFPDSMTATWSEENVSGLLASAFAPQLAAQASSQSAPMATIDILLTFDQSGVSYHPNHRSLYHGARAFLKALMRGNSGHPCPVTLYTLTSTTLARKYIGVFDAPIAMLSGVISNAFGGSGDRDALSTSPSKKTQELRGIREPPPANRLLFVNSVDDWLSGWKAMVYAHKSQMVWFRWGWITVGRYMVVNDLKKELV